MADRRPQKGKPSETYLRVIGGSLKGSKILYTGDPGTRPMKDRVRESLFNLLGTAAKDSVAVDLFAGTGAVAIEALSRGANRAVAIERNFPMADAVRKNAAALNVADRIEVHSADTFIWSMRLVDEGALPESLSGDNAWSIFCCPPYALYVDRTGDMLALIERMLQLAPSGSTMIVEADERFDFGTLPNPEAWDVRSYAPAFLGRFTKQSN